MEPIYRLPPDWKLNRVTTALSEVYDWSLKFLGIPDLWAQTRGQGIKVAVLDTGYAEHPDLEGAVVAAKDFSGSAFGPEDRAGHGTWCLGAIGARAGNNIGVAGVAPKCQLLAGKVLGDNGAGDDRSILAGLQWAIAQGADIISMSLGGPMMSQRLRQVIAEFVAEPGKFVFAAAGNDGHAQNRDTVNYPAKWLECICVGAVDKVGNIAQFSSDGPRVDIFAPGTDMISTVPGGYGSMSGTSMATPIAAAVGVLALSKHQQHGGQTDLRTVAQMREHLKKTATHKGNVGLVNPKELLAGLDGQPAQPAPIAAWSKEVPGGTITFTPSK